uniref:Fibronectin type-III domain-containing protein n=1 Tax=Neogobius melanostomus TaxID=47308 RepID=A0A8C6SK69_9GOBI
QPTNVTFTSVNLRNILQWSPGKDTPTNTKYHVNYAIYGERKEKRVHWRSVPHCTEITRTWCDLSEETSDLEHGYYAKVRAVSRKSNSKWVLTKRFHPKHDIEFGPPNISVEVDDKYAVITIEGPMKYLPNNNTPQVSMATLYPHLTYNLSIHNTQSGQIHHFILTSNQYKYRTMNHGPKCVFLPEHSQSMCPPNTIPQPGTASRHLKVTATRFTGRFTVLLCLLGVGSYILYKYLLGTDQKSPSNLVRQIWLSSFITTLFTLYIHAYASQNSFLQSLSSSASPVLLNQSGENRQGLLCANAETGSSDGNEWGNVVSFGYASQNVRAAQPSNQFHDLPDDYGLVSCEGYASQNAISMQPVSQSDLLPDCYGLAGRAASQEGEESSCLQIDWSPTTQRLVIPGFDLGMEHGEGGSPPTNRVHLDTVFVRQPSEEEALLGAEGGESGQWDAEEFMAKFDLVISSD